MTHLNVVKVTVVDLSIMILILQNKLSREIELRILLSYTVRTIIRNYNDEI